MLHTLTADDWPLLRDVRLRALSDAPDAFGSTLALARQLTEADWRRRAGNGHVVVAHDDHAPDHGLAMGGALAPDGGPTAFVWGMWTDPAARGRGLGGRVLDALLEHVTARAHAEVRLHVTEGNDGARRLYTSRGFTPTGTWEPLREGSALRIEELVLALR
jgi:ribosomal protein S18 acetylase RimI-like enzyme